MVRAWIPASSAGSFDMIEVEMVTSQRFANKFGKGSTTHDHTEAGPPERRNAGRPQDYITSSIQHFGVGTAIIVRVRHPGVPNPSGRLYSTVCKRRAT